jgi:hypothetical protein
MSWKPSPLQSSAARAITRMSSRLCCKFPHYRRGFVILSSFSFSFPIFILHFSEYMVLSPSSLQKSKCRNPGISRH